MTLELTVHGLEGIKGHHQREIPLRLTPHVNGGLGVWPFERYSLENKATSRNLGDVHVLNAEILKGANGVRAPTLKEIDARPFHSGHLQSLIPYLQYLLK